MSDNQYEPEAIRLSAAREEERYGEMTRRLFSSRDGKKVLQLLKNHFNFHLSSSAVVGWDTNQTFYQDGNKAPFHFIDAVLENREWQKITQEQQPDEET